MARVSVVVVTRDCSKHVEATLGSVRRQTHADLEVLVWDDGSADDTVERAQRAVNGEPRFRIVSAETQGTLRAAKDALRVTSGTLVCWVDGGDALAPDAIARCVAALQRFPQASFVYSRYAWMQPDGVIGPLGDDCTVTYTMEKLLTHFMTTQLRLLRRSAWEAVGGLDSTLDEAADYDLCLKLSERGPVLHIPHVLCFRRRHAAAPLAQQQAILQAQRCAIERALERRGLAGRFEVDLELFGRYRLERVPK